MNIKDKLDEKTLKEIIKAFYVHHKLMNHKELEKAKLNFMNKKVLNMHKNNINKIYEELENVQ